MRNCYNEANKEGIFNMSDFTIESKLRSEKSRRKLIHRNYYIVKANELATTEEAIESKSEQSVPPQKRDEIGIPRINTGKKVMAGKARNIRTGPQGKQAMISNSAVDSISEKTEERTRKAIAKIGKSIGF